MKYIVKRLKAERRPYVIFRHSPDGTSLEISLLPETRFFTKKEAKERAFKLNEALLIEKLSR